GGDKLRSVPDGLARRDPGAGAGQHPRPHAGRDAGTGRRADLRRWGQPGAGGSLRLRGGRPLGAAGAVCRCLLCGQVRRCCVPHLPRRPGAARPGELRPAAGGIPDGPPKSLYAGRGLQRAQPQDRRVFPGVPAAVRRPRDGRHGPPTAHLWPDLRAAHPGALLRLSALLGDRRLVVEDPPEVRGRAGMAYRGRPDLPRPPPGPSGPSV
ncbi:MAG: hypothetical protein AVDCRST_MAG01-01-2001, partial [uncultured Rubrobacteraceae bacterium]